MFNYHAYAVTNIFIRPGVPRWRAITSRYTVDFSHRIGEALQNSRPLAVSRKTTHTEAIGMILLRRFLRGGLCSCGWREVFGDPNGIDSQLLEAGDRCERLFL